MCIFRQSAHCSEISQNSSSFSPSIPLHLIPTLCGVDIYDEIRLNVARSYTSSHYSPFHLISSLTNCPTLFSCAFLSPFSLVLSRKQYAFFDIFVTLAFIAQLPRCICSAAKKSESSIRIDVIVSCYTLLVFYSRVTNCSVMADYLVRDLESKTQYGGSATYHQHLRLAGKYYLGH